jgi:hypothetical protein
MTTTMSFGLPRSRVRVLADDQDPYVVEGLLEGPEYVRPGRQVGAPGGDFGTQEVAHPADASSSRGERFGPPGLDDFFQWSCCHGASLYCRPRFTPQHTRQAR